VRNFYEALSGNVGLLAIVLGIMGLTLVAVRDHRAGHLDPLPMITTVVLAASITAEMWQGLPGSPRYTTTIGALLVVGIGWLVGAIRPGAAGGWLAGTIAIAASVLMIGVAVLLLEQALPAVKQARVCGTISATGPVHRRNAILSTLSALGRLPLTTFSPIQDGAWRRSGVILRIKRNSGPRGRKAPFPAPLQDGQTWVEIRTPAGRLFLTKACVRKGGALPGARTTPYA
jgi:hypothetical protein